MASFVQRPDAMRWPLLLALLASAGACTGSTTPDDPCADGHCDLPTDPAEVSCTKRRADAFDDNHGAFTESFLRWSCNDVQGVTLDDRGQEYCEYFAIAALPDDASPRVLGKNLGPDSSYGTTPASLELAPDQIAALEADEQAVVGQCVFTSWNSDIPGPVPACDGGACPDVLGLPVDEATFRMTFDVNSTDAAQQLVDDCFVQPTGDEADAFTRGCLWNAEINQTEFRKSDTTICTSMVRLAECGCGVTGDVTLPELISPYSKRGFPLGGWADPHGLPANCRYVELGDASQTVVTCDLTAADLLYGGAADVRALCQDKYADNVVVHVPVDTSMVRCDPSSSKSPYAATCSATPWIVTE
jgi:hypothetical protein